MCRMQTVQAFEDMRAAGLIKAWGVSNWEIRDLEQVGARSRRDDCCILRLIASSGKRQARDCLAKGAM